MRIVRSIDAPRRRNPDWEARWGSLEAGLITSWERGRELAVERPDLAEAARGGELIPLSWKGGIPVPSGRAKPPRRKYGSLYYLAMWQGLRGDDLDIDADAAPQLTCARHGTIVSFTTDSDLLDRK